MILVDSIYINNGGGKILLDVLVKSINATKINVQFLFDDRIANNYKREKFINPPIFLKAGLKNRKNFYNLNKNKYTHILTFGNVPPPIKLNILVYTYLHNVLYLEEKKYLNFFNNFIIYLKSFYIRSLNNNTNYWIVQTSIVKNKLANKWNFSKDKILLFPFYQDFSVDKTNSRLKNTNSKITYLYVSNGENYKNHKKLFDAFKKFSIGKSNVELKVTISNNYPYLISVIEDLNKSSVPITNLGLLNKNDLQSVYASADVVLFPSFFESFGLGLIEAAQNNLPVLASNCEYVYEVIKPSMVFDPINADSIIKTLEYSYRNNLEPAKLVVENKIDDLLSLLTL